MTQVLLLGSFLTREQNFWKCNTRYMPPPLPIVAGETKEKSSWMGREDDKCYCQKGHFKATTLEEILLNPTILDNNQSASNTQFLDKVLKQVPATQQQKFM